MMKRIKNYIYRNKPYLVFAALVAVASAAGGWRGGLTILGLAIGFWISRQWMKEGDD